MIAERENLKRYHERLSGEAPAENAGAQRVRPVEASPQPVEPPKPEPPKKPAHLHVDERKMQTMYGNAFRTYATPEEVMLDFGVAEFHGPAAAGEPVDVNVQAKRRLVMTYYSAKRLALLLAKAIHEYEKRFGTVDARSLQIRVGPPSPPRKD